MLATTAYLSIRYLQYFTIIIDEILYDDAIYFETISILPHTAVFVILIYNAVCLHKVIALPFMRQHSSRQAGASSLYRSVIISRIAIATRRHQTRLFPANN